MKIDLITLHSVKNYGSILQTFATQELFKEYGFDVTIINYIRKDILNENIFNTWCGNNILKKTVLFPAYKRWQKVFDGFINKEIRLSSGVFVTEADFINYPLTADLYCTGSDQVWNSKWNNGIEHPLYLSFVPSSEFKFSFASSFGTDKISEDEVNETKKYIDQYRYLSVREETGKEIIESQYGYPLATRIIDPTCVMSAKFWRRFTSQRIIKEDYFLVYNLNRSKDFDRYAVKLAKIAGLKLVRLCTRYDQLLLPGKSILIPEVFDFINLIDNANIVLTDSFHATAFSISLGTEPICVYPSEFGGRIEGFLKMTNCLQRHSVDFNDLDVLNRHIDFEKVEVILDVERRKVRKYLQDVFTNAENTLKQS